MSKNTKLGFRIISKPKKTLAESVQLRKNMDSAKRKSSAETETTRKTVPVKKQIKNTNNEQKPKLKTPGIVLNKSKTNGKNNNSSSKPVKNIAQTLRVLHKYMNDFKIILKLFKCEFKDKPGVNHSVVFAKLKHKYKIGPDAKRVKYYYLEFIKPSEYDFLELNECLEITSFSIMSDSNIIFRTEKYQISAELLISIKRLTPISSFDKGFALGK